jgi:hypothetical protein
VEWTGLFELALGALVLLRPARSVLLFVFGWIIATELVRPVAGEEIGQFIERAGSDAGPFALALNGCVRRHRPSTNWAPDCRYVWVGSGRPLPVAGPAAKLLEAVPASRPGARRIGGTVASERRAIERTSDPSDCRATEPMDDEPDCVNVTNCTGLSPST